MSKRLRAGEITVLIGQGAAIETTTPAGQPISERTIAGLTAARARGRTGGRPCTMTSVKIRLAAAATSR